MLINVVLCICPQLRHFIILEVICRSRRYFRGHGDQFKNKCGCTISSDSFLKVRILLSNRQTNNTENDERKAIHRAHSEISMLRNEMSMLKYVHVPKYSCSEISMFRNFHVSKCPCSKMSMFQNVYVPKCTRSEMYMFRNVHVPKFPCTKISMFRNVHVPKFPCSKISMFQNF